MQLEDLASNQNLLGKNHSKFCLLLQFQDFLTFFRAHVTEQNSCVATEIPEYQERDALDEDDDLQEAPVFTPQSNSTIPHSQLFSTVGKVTKFRPKTLYVHDHFEDWDDDWQPNMKSTMTDF